MKLRNLIAKSIGTIGLSALVSCSNINNRPNMEEANLIGFPSQYYLADVYNDKKLDLTKGIIIEIDRTKSDLSVVDSTESKIVYKGDIFYKIYPETKFAPKENHSDRYGNSHWNEKENKPNPNYWQAVREGTIVLKKIDK